MSDQTLNKTLNSLLAIMRGIAEVLTAGKTMPFRNGTIDGPGLQALVAPLLALVQAVGDKKTAYKAAIDSRNAAKSTIDALIADVKKGCSLGFGDSSVEFEQFGFAPKKKPTTLTPEQKQQKLERMRATRAARGTMGSRQRKAVRGVVPTPPSPPSTPGQGGVAPAK
jgi:ADP-heptose:LPS heptosyltransferase